MSKSTTEERQSAALAAAERAENLAKGHAAKASLYEAKGKTEKAADCAERARRQEVSAAGHRATAERLALKVQREAGVVAAGVARKAALDRASARTTADLPRPDPLQLYTECLQHAAELEQEAEQLQSKARSYERAGDQGKADKVRYRAQERLKWAKDWRAAAAEAQAGTDRDLVREHKLAAKARHRMAGKARNETDRLAGLGLVSDLATAAAQREIVAGGVRKHRVASLAEYAALIRRPQDRTSARVEAIAEFDELCGKAEAGLFAEPKFEAESARGYGPGALVMEKRAAGLAEMQSLVDRIGARNVAMLRERIFLRRSLIALARDGYGTERTIGSLFLSAVDSMRVCLAGGSALDARIASAGEWTKAKQMTKPTKQASA